MTLIERIDARLLNLWAEKKNCEFKHDNPDCQECKQADEIISEFQDCKSCINRLKNGLKAVDAILAEYPTGE